MEINNNIVNLVTPTLKFNPGYVEMNGILVRIMAITRFPPEVSNAWLSRLANIPDVALTIHNNVVDSTELIDKMNKSASGLRNKILDEKTKADTVNMAKHALADIEKILDRINYNGEKIVDVTVLIMVKANDLKELDSKTKQVQTVAASTNLTLRTAVYRQEEALKSIAPFMDYNKEIRNFARRNMPVSTLAAGLPFTNGSLNDKSGFLLGRDKEGSVILIDSWKRGGDRTNSNWTILGASGSGKSTFAKHKMFSEWLQGTIEITIDPEREYKYLCEQLKGQWVQCGGGKNVGKINPLQVRKAPKDIDKEDNGLGELALHIQFLKTFFKLYLGKSLTDVDMANLEITLEEIYKNKHIDWNMKVEDYKNEDYPTMIELYNLLEEKAVNNKEYEKLSKLLRSAAIGADSELLNGHTTIELTSDFIVLDTFDLQNAEDKLKRAQYFNVLSYCWNQISQNREQSVSLNIDEAYLLVDPQVPQALQTLRNMSKRVRKYEGSINILSQNVIDFLSPEVRRYGEALLDNACFKMLMGTDGKDLEELTNIMKLREAEQALLSKKVRGEGLLIAGSKRVHAIVNVPEFEFELFGKGGGR